MVVVAPEAKIRNAEDIDNVVWARIPGQEEHPKLYEIVTSHMVHGPCGSLNPNSPCMEGVKPGSLKCNKKYPMDFIEETRMGEDSFAFYKRPDDGKKITKNGCELDNRYIVPYSPYLSLKYSAHINVEICASVKSVKYLYKYVYKGHDAAKMVIANGGENVLIHDEIKNFVEMRYVAPHEGIFLCQPFFSKSLFSILEIDEI